jgi:predicted Zn-dependent protease
MTVSDRTVVVRGLGAALVVVAGIAGLAWGALHWLQQRALEDAIQLVGDGAYSAAVPALVAATTAEPADPRAHYYLARAYFCLGAHAGALAQLRRAVPGPRRDPGDGAARAALALDRGDRDSALEILRDEIHRHPDALDARLFLADTLDVAGDHAGVNEQRREVARRAGGSALATILAPPIATVSPHCR